MPNVFDEALEEPKRNVFDDAEAEPSIRALAPEGGDTIRVPSLMERAKIRVQDLAPDLLSTDELLSGKKRGALPAAWDEAVKPLVEVPRVTAEDVSPRAAAALLGMGANLSQRITGDTDAPQKLVAGAERGLAGIAEGIASPLGVATLGISALPRAAARLISGGFAAHMASGTPELARNLGTAVGEGDLERGVEAGIGLAANTAFAGAAGAHALSPKTRPSKIKPSDVRAMDSGVVKEKALREEFGIDEVLPARIEPLKLKEPVPNVFDEAVKQPVVVEQKAEPVAEAAKPNEKIDVAFSDAAKGAVDSLYDGMLERMNAGKLPEPFPAEKQSSFAKQAKDAFDAGRVKTPEDLKTLANEPKITSPVEAPRAAPKMIEGLESWADEVIKKSRGRVSSGLDPELFTAYAVKGAAVIVRGVYDAGQWAAEMVREYGDEIREHLPEIRRRANELIDNNFQGVDMPAKLDPKMGERAHPKMVDASSKISNDVRLQQGPRLYERRTNEGDAAAARKILEESGVESAERMFRDPSSDIPGSVRTALGDEIVDYYGRQEQLSAMTGDKVAERKAFDAQSEFLEDVTMRSTDVAQSLQMYKRWGKASISVVLAKAKKVIETAEGEFKPEVSDAIKKQHKKIKDAPEGFQKTREEVELANIISRAAGVKWWELPLSMWYANILTGVTTHGVNVLSATANFGMNLAVEALKHPTNTPGLVQAAVRGGRKGLTEAREVMETGKVTGTRLQKAEALRTLEIHKFKGLMQPFNILKYNGRLMSAEDLILFKAAEEARAFAVARKVSRGEGLKGDALERRVVEILGHTQERLAASRARAKLEGLTGRDYRRRVDELVEQSRPQHLRTDAKDWALKTTFNQKPTGVLGELANAINGFAAKVPPARLVVPFTNIVANVMNSSLDYFPPTSVARAGWAMTKKGTLDNRPITDKSLVVDQWIKAGIGTAAITTIGLLASKHSGDEDPAIAITGNGPDSIGHKKQLAERGWIPNSIKIGDNYFSYAWTPMALPMAALGNYMDAVKYKQLDKTDLDNRLAYAIGASARVVLEQGFLTGISDLVEFLQRDSPKRSSERMLKWMTRTASSAVIPNAVRQIDRIFDPTVYDAKTVEANLYASVPFVRRLNKPALNVLGQPVQRFVSERFLSEGRPDPIWRLLAEKNVWVSTPDRDTLINEVPLSDDEYYRYVELSGKDIHQWIGEYTEAITEADEKEASRILRKLTDVARDRAKDAIAAERK